MFPFRRYAENPGPSGDATKWQPPGSKFSKVRARADASTATVKWWGRGGGSVKKPPAAVQSPPIVYETPSWAFWHNFAEIRCLNGHARTGRLAVGRL